SATAASRGDANTPSSLLSRRPASLSTTGCIASADMCNTLLGCDSRGLPLQHGAAAAPESAAQDQQAGHEEQRDQDPQAADHADDQVNGHDGQDDGDDGDDGEHPQG